LLTLTELRNPNDVEAKANLQAAYDRVIIDVEPLLQDWLQSPESDDERADLDMIRQTYLPDIVLGYISVLYFSGHRISRDILLKIMNLAIDVASEDSNVGACFLSAGRMAELVDVLAVGSVGVLRAEEAMVKKRGGKVKKSKPGPRGENLDIWNMKVPSNAPVMDE
jgi:nuclear pore complex protein Nup107